MPEYHSTKDPLVGIIQPAPTHTISSITQVDHTKPQHCSEKYNEKNTTKASKF